MIEQPELFPEPMTGVLVHAHLVDGKGWTVTVRMVNRVGSVTRDAHYERLLSYEATDVLLSEVLDRMSSIEPD